MILQGNKKLLDDKLAVVLNSSQSKTPCGNDSWVIQTTRAITQLTSLGYTMVTSTGLSTWELAVYLVNSREGNQVIVSPASDDLSSEEIFAGVVEDFGLNPDRTAMIFTELETDSRSPKDNWLLRDQAAITLAQKVVPVSIRQGGRLHSLLEDPSFASKCNNDFKIELEKPVAGPKHYELNSIKSFENWNYITHWTKTCHGPWPGEPRSSYYSRLVSSGNEFPNQAANTLMNIISEKKLRASANWMREGRSAIGFTESAPAQALSLMRWRPKRVNWNFEPYGLAIDKKTAKALGIRPAIYGDQQKYETLADEDKPYFQFQGGVDVDWSLECEWRHLGDLNLGDIPEDKIRYLVWDLTEAAKLENLAPGRVMNISAI